MRRWASALGDAPLGDQEAHDLGDEQRIPLCLGMDHLDQLGRRLDAGRELDVRCHVALAEPTSAI